MFKIIKNVIFGLVFFVGGVALLVMGIMGYNQAMKSYEYVPAVISSVETVEEKDFDDKMKSVDYYKVEYTYNGKEYKSDLKDAKSGYSEGNEIKAFVSVDNPRNITMKSHRTELVRIALGALLALGGIAGVFTPLVSSKKDVRRKA